MAQLHEGDVAALANYYENEVASLKVELTTVRDNHSQDR
jgi:hypothetical protein